MTAVEFVSSEDVFLKVVECGNFASAARVLSLPNYTVSRRIVQIEQRLGAVLLRRNSRTIGLTEAGRIYHDYCLRVQDARRELRNQLSEKSGALTGELRISVPLMLARHVFRRLAEEFAALHPNLSVVLVPASHYVDLVKEDYDLAVRVGRLADSSLIARRLTPARRVVVASPDYLRRSQLPVAPDDLTDHDCLIEGARAGAATWRFYRNGEQADVHVAGNFICSDAEIIIDACRAGRGVAVIPEIAVRQDLYVGHLIRLLTDWNVESKPVSLVFPSANARLPKLRAFIDFITDRIDLEAPWASGGELTIAAEPATQSAA